MSDENENDFDLPRMFGKIPGEELTEEEVRMTMLLQEMWKRKHNCGIDSGFDIFLRVGFFIIQVIGIVLLIFIIVILVKG